MKINQDNIKDTICKKGSTRDSRHVTRATKKKVFDRYGLDYCHDSSKYEVDHFISLELGGDNDIDNLWPQRYAPAPGAREKDVVETHLKRSICSGVLTLNEGQKIIQQDWYACYKAIKAGKECSLKK